MCVGDFVLSVEIDAEVVKPLKGGSQWEMIRSLGYYPWKSPKVLRGHQLLPPRVSYSKRI
jgi:hypothetical protein